MIFNPNWFDNSQPDGIAVIEIIGIDPEKRGFIPLKTTHLEGMVNGPLGDFSITHTFRLGDGTGKGPIEALYRFPLPGDVAVYELLVKFGDTEIRSELKSLQTAKQEYFRAKEEGKSSALLTRESPNVFTLSITGISAGEDVTVTTRYYHVGTPEIPGFSFRIPLTTAPRYVRPDEVSSYKDSQPLAVMRDPGHRFSLSIRTLHGTLHCQTHLISEKETNRYSLASGEVVPDKDCVLAWVPEGNTTLPTVHMFSDGAEEPSFLAIVNAPDAPEHTFPRDVILLLDHSGSMEGPKWEAANWAVEKFLKGLTELDRFNVCLFETHTYWFSDDPVPATLDTINKTVEFIGDKRSGGTELGIALEQALSQKRTSGDVSRQALIITDAEVTDHGRILRLVDWEQKREDARRISILCIDSSPNAFLANQVAERGGGIAKFLTSSPDERDITSAMDQIMHLWDAPAAIGMTLEFNRNRLLVDSRGVKKAGESTCEVDIGDIPAGISTWISGKAPNGEEPLRCILNESGIRTEIPITKWPAVRALFGARLINEIELIANALMYDDNEKKSLIAGLGYSINEFAGREKKVYHENQIRDVHAFFKNIVQQESLKYGIISSETAFIAVRNEKGEQVQETITIPNALPKGWSETFISYRGSQKRVNPKSIELPKNRRIRDLASGGAMLDLSGGGISSKDSMICQPDGTMKMDTRPGASYYISPDTSGLYSQNMSNWCVFSGRPQFVGNTARLFDSSRKDNSMQASYIPVFREMVLTVIGGNVAEDSLIELHLFVNDMAVPLVNIRIHDLMKAGGTRPLNIRCMKNSLVVVRLVDPKGEWSANSPVIKLEIKGKGSFNDGTV